MKIKKKYRVLLAVLAACVLLAGGASIWLHGEWWYPALVRWRRYDPPALTVTALSGEGLTLTLEELTARENVRYGQELMLVNAAHPLPSDFVPFLTEYNGARMNESMRNPYIALRDAAEAATGIRIYVSSDYRTPEEQAEILASAEEGIAAPIGCSEHEAGLALDVYAPYYAGEEFLGSRAGRWVNEHCAEYGYIIRYPNGKQEITGISYEPWHLRYVGAPHAEIMTAAGLTLEEYIALFAPNQWYETDEYLISRRTSNGSWTLPTAWESCHISPDNTGYYFVTLKISK